MVIEWPVMTWKPPILIMTPNRPQSALCRHGRYFVELALSAKSCRLQFKNDGLLINRVPTFSWTVKYRFNVSST